MPVPGAASTEEDHKGTPMTFEEIQAKYVARVTRYGAGEGLPVEICGGHVALREVPRGALTPVLTFQMVADVDTGFSVLFFGRAVEAAEFDALYGADGVEAFAPFLADAALKEAGVDVPVAFSYTIASAGPRRAQ